MMVTCSPGRQRRSSCRWRLAHGTLGGLASGSRLARLRRRPIRPCWDTDGPVAAVLGEDGVTAGDGCAADIECRSCTVAMPGGEGAHRPAGRHQVDELCGPRVLLGSFDPELRDLVRGIRPDVGDALRAAAGRQRGPGELVRAGDPLLRSRLEHKLDFGAGWTLRRLLLPAPLLPLAAGLVG